jgi:hypothetical protein
MNFTEELLPVGTRVHVNHYHGEITEIITSVEKFDVLSGERLVLNIVCPVYRVKLDLTQRHKAFKLWNTPAQQYIPQEALLAAQSGCPFYEVQLFKDEFEILE